MLNSPIARSVVSVAPTSEPVTRAEAKKQLELPSSQTDHDDYVDDLIQFGRELVEKDSGGWTGYQTTFVLKLDQWPKLYIELDRRPLISVSSITYLDTAGDSQTWSSANYEVDIRRVLPVIWPAYAVTWPAIRSIQNAITVTYVAGYATVATIPMLFKQAVLVAISREFDDRTGQRGRWDDAYESLIQRLVRNTVP